MHELVAAAFQDGWRPDPVLTALEWSDTHVRLDSSNAAAPGPYSSDRTPYVKEILESLSPTDSVRRVVWQAGAQLGKSQAGFNWLGAIADQWPGPTLMVQPTVDMAKKVSKQRLAPMINNTEVLRAKFAENKSRDASNTMLEKEFPGGFWILTGANSASGLRSMPIRYLYLDEVDAYPADVDGEGSPMDLAEKRTTTFARRKIFITSTPTVKGFSAVEREYEQSDKRKYFVPCPHCGEYAPIEWRNIKWTENKPETAQLLCESCGCLIDERHKTQMLAAGQWRPTATSKHGTRGYHLNGLYSPLGWKSWADCVREFLDAKGNIEKLKVWVNTVLAETFEEKGDSVDPASLAARREVFAAEVPRGGIVLTAAVDVQGDRLEAQVKAWGEGEESWLVAYSQFIGDPGQSAVWDELDAFMLASFKAEDGRELRIDTTLIDSGGHHTDAVYKFCKARQARRIFPLKGVQQAGRPIAGNPSRNNKYRVPLYLIGVDAAKELVVSRLRISLPGPGYMHLPDWTDDEYLAQLTAEKAIRKYVRGRGTVREWVKTRERNEAFDLEVYALAALYLRGPAWLARHLKTHSESPTAQPEQPAAAAAPAPARTARQLPASRASAEDPAPRRRYGNKTRTTTGAWSV